MILFARYLRENFKWFAALSVSGLMMTAIMLLNHIPFSEIAYGMLVYIFIITLIAGSGFYKYYHVCKELELLEKVITVSTGRMRQPEYMYEAQYQQCIRLLEQEKNSIQNDMLDRQQDLSEYYSMWVHQIKTPIAALKLLLDEEAHMEGATESGINAANSAQKQQELFKIEQYVDMALQYMRLGSESTDFVFSEISLDSVIKASIHKFAIQFIHKKLSLHYEPTQAAAVTDGKWLGFVIGQLLSNAIKYTRSGGITISVENRIYSTEEVHIIIEDTGIGISASDLPRVCDKGYTGYNGHEDRHSTGIGLYLCRQILDRLGHEFILRSTEGVGTSAEIVIIKNV